MVSDRELEDFKNQAADKRKQNAVVPKKHIDLKACEDLTRKVHKINRNSEKEVLNKQMLEKRQILEKQKILNKKKNVVIDQN
jgi:hypothetical protein